MPKKGKSRRKQPKIHRDERGDFVWETYFVGGKQKRQKNRVTVIDGEIIDDLDEWLVANANDIYLHQIERWDLIEQRRLEEEGPPPENAVMKPPPRTLRLDIDELETAFDCLSEVDGSFDRESYYSFLDLTSGGIVSVESEEEVERMLGDENLLELPPHIFEGLFYGGLNDFVYSLPDDPLRRKLEQAIRGKGAFRRFKAIVFGGGEIELKHRWYWFETRRKRKRIVEWLEEHNIEPDWGCDIFEPPALPDKRSDLLRAVRDFVSDACRLSGVRRIALLGSLTTSKAIPKDVDLLVEVDDDMSLAKLAAFKRQLLGKTMQTGDGCGADVFLCNPQGEYIGRICSWKKCGPGIRNCCEAQRCGRRKYLYDDLQNVILEPSLVREPPLELWPERVARVDLPDDVQQQLVLAAGPKRGGN